MKAKQVLLMMVVLTAAVLVAAFTIASCLDCQERGGAYVQGVVGPQCVERAR